MMQEQYMYLKVCIQCLEEIKLGAKVILVYKDDQGENFVHAEKCWDAYKKLLFSRKAVKQGYIIGMCEACAKPVRHKQEFEICREARKIEQRDSHIFYTTFPSKENGHCVRFMHKKCAERIFS